MYAPTSTNSPRSGPNSGDEYGLRDFEGAAEILRAWGNGIRPDPDLTVSEWADRHRMLASRASAEPGRYRTMRTPYMREIMDRLSPGDAAQRIVFMKAAQVGATEAGNNWIGFAIHQAPGPMLAVQPTDPSDHRPPSSRSGLFCAWRSAMTTMTYKHWRDVPDRSWRWKNFSPAEIACRGSGSLRINEEALDKLQALRDRLGKPLIVRSAYRSPAHNRAVGGAPRSKHMDGTAFDIAMAKHDPVAFEAAARAVGFLGFGYYPRSGFMHIDLGPARQWGERFPVRATAFAAETPPAREVLAHSRTMKGSGAAGVATLGAAGVEVAQSVLAETQTAILPLVPYLDTLRWVLIAVALAGLAVTIYARIDDWKRGRR